MEVPDLPEGFVEDYSDTRSLYVLWGGHLALAGIATETFLRSPVESTKEAMLTTIANLVQVEELLAGEGVELPLNRIARSTQAKRHAWIQLYRARDSEHETWDQAASEFLRRIGETVEERPASSEPGDPTAYFVGWGASVVAVVAAAGHYQQRPDPLSAAAVLTQSRILQQTEAWMEAAGVPLPLEAIDERARTCRRAAILLHDSMVSFERAIDE